MASMTASNEAEARADFATLQGQKYINLTTFRKSGVPVVTPVWFVQEDERLYVMTTANAGKVKRVRNSGRVLVALSDSRGKPLGPNMRAQARLLPATQAAQIERLLNRKYGLFKRGFDLMMGLVRLVRRPAASRAYIEIVPGS